MTLSAFLRALLRRWRVVLAFALLGVIAASAVTWQMPKRYEAKAQSFVSSSSTQGTPQNSQLAAQRVSSYVLLVDSPTILDPVIDDLGLHESRVALARRVDVQNPPDTTILNVTVTDSDPKRAAKVANAVSLEMVSTIEDVENPDTRVPPTRTPSGSGTASATKAPVKVIFTTPAVAPTRPVSPIWQVNLALGLVIGLALGCAVAVLREGSDDTLSGVSELELTTGVPNLTTTQQIRRAGWPALLSLDPSDPNIEAYRLLRSNIRFAAPDSPPRSLLVTSAAPDEGKTTTAINLAISLAQSGSRVCLVDADLRRPDVATNLGLEGAVGLSNVLVGDYSLTEATATWNHGLLRVLPSGTIPADAAALVGSHQMRSLVEHLTTAFDCVVFDTPPVTAVSDAAILAGSVDGVIVVARRGRSRRADVVAAFDQLRRAHAHVMGTVLTFSQEKVASYGYAPQDDAGRSLTPQVDAQSDRELSPTATDETS